MKRIANAVTCPFRAAVAWHSDRGNWLSIPFRDHYMVLRSVDAVTEGRLTEEQAEAQLSVYAEQRERKQK